MLEAVEKKHSHYYLLLVIIYLGYISLGLPDTVLGVAWPRMRLDLNQGVEWAGALATMIILCSAVSGFSSGFFINRVAAGTLLMVSCFMTGLSLLGFGLAPSFAAIVLLAIPLGLGGGCIDAAMNSYIARHYSSRHMSWLHGSWGVGATIGPAIMTTAIAGGSGWRWGYGTIALIQLSMGVAFILTLRLWGNEYSSASTATEGHVPSMAEGRWRPWGDLSAWYSVLTFFFYTGAEYGFGLWGAIFLMSCRGFTVAEAGYSVALYWGSLTAGRFISGCIADRAGNRRMVIGGIMLALCGLLIQWLSAGHYMLWAGLALTGCGLAPIYPCMMHETSRRFPGSRGNIIIGFQSGSACVGIALLPSLTGWVGGWAGFALLPWALGGFLVLLLGLNVLLNRRT